MPSTFYDSGLSDLARLVREDPRAALWLVRATASLRRHQDARGQVDAQLAGLGAGERDLRGAAPRPGVAMFARRQHDQEGHETPRRGPQAATTARRAPAGVSSGRESSRVAWEGCKGFIGKGRGGSAALPGRGSGRGPRGGSHERAGTHRIPAQG